MNIYPKLQMNLHPKDAENLSLVNALNIKLANDESCITNEESIIENIFISNTLKEFYGSNNYTIISIIPCNVELVIISIDNTKSDKAQIFRYREATTTNEESMKCVYGNDDNNYLNYHGGKIKGTFTYNVENSLIIAIAEYDVDNIKIPLRTINLGNYDNETIFNDKKVPDKLLSIAPEVYIPSMKNLEYVKGNTYKGWYYLFIRFKINSIDYTQWYNFGFPIYVDTIEQFNITKYCFRQTYSNIESQNIANKVMYPTDANDGFCVGASDYFSNETDIANETFKIDISFNENDLTYKYYQIGLVCSSKSYTKTFKTSDIKLDTIEKEFILNKEILTEASIEEFITDNFNYYNVKNIINYQNRLYISNYEENNANDKINDNILNAIKISLNHKALISNSFTTNQTIATAEIETVATDIGTEDPYIETKIKKEIYTNNQYDTKNDSIDASLFFNIDENTIVSINGDAINYSEEPSQLTYKALEDVPIKNVKIVSGLLDLKNDTVAYPSDINLLVDQSGTKYKFNSNSTIRFDKTIAFTINKYFIDRGINYINPNKSFNNRKSNTTLIPGEVYNFFIHFVDKYGHATNGYRLNNNIIWKAKDYEDIEIAPISFSYLEKTYYAALPIDTNVLHYNNGELELNTNNIKIYTKVNLDDIQNPKLEYPITNDKQNIYIDYFKHFFNNFVNKKYIDLKWYQLNTGYISNLMNDNNVSNKFNPVFFPYINNNNDRLFKIPIIPNKSNIINIFNINVENVNLPKGYIGWFISYEKFEPLKRVTGVLTRNDFKTQIEFNKASGVNKKVDLNNVNNEKSDSMYFYSGQFDIKDNIKLDYNLMKIDGINVFDSVDVFNFHYLQRSFYYKFCYDYNKPQLDNIYENRYAPNIYPMTDYKLSVADSIIDGREGVGTALKLKDSYMLFPNTINPNVANVIEKSILYKITLYNITRNIYMSKNKTLIRCTNIIYDKKLSDKDVISNGVITYDGCIIYEHSGLNFNEANNIAYRTWNNTKYYPSDVDGKNSYEVNTPFMAYMQYPCIDDHFYESKCFKNKPGNRVFYVKQDKEHLENTNENNKFATGCIITPANTIDVFQNKQDSFDKFNPKTYTNYREDLISIDEFNKTIRRSNVIKDESRINNWRTFSIEGYKNITENKGIITNLIGVGTMFLVHTEHSLFVFNTNNSLETKDKSIQLYQPDAFDVNYQEVFTSSLGFGGLQDDKSFIVDQFGYIFYNNDFHRFYNFDNGQLKIIDDDIIQWLDKYNPYNVRFANDKFNNRILIKMNYKVNNIEKYAIISYNYNSKQFISLHSYYFDDAYNTKAKLYLKCDDEFHTNCSLHQFVQDGSSYGSFDNVKNNLRINTTTNSKIGIIINQAYDDIKYLEHISYKLNKFVNPAEIDYTYSPVEGTIIPYSADLLKIYNNQVNTGELDILIDKEEDKNIFNNYKKPYWELGNWNYNYLRNNISNYNKYGDGFDMSRLYGNYFVIEFTFSNKDNLKVEFEGLDYKLIK